MTTIEKLQVSPLTDQLDELSASLQPTLREQELTDQEISLLAMHLRHIEAEAAEYLEQMRCLRDAARRGDAEAIIDALIELETSISHFSNHVPDVRQLLLVVVGLDDEEGEKIASAI